MTSLRIGKGPPSAAALPETRDGGVPNHFARNRVDGYTTEGLTRAVLDNVERNEATGIRHILREGAAMPSYVLKEKFLKKTGNKSARRARTVQDSDPTQGVRG